MNPNLQTQQQLKFFSSLADFLINTGRLKPSQRDKFQETSEEFYPLKLYKLVCRRGGFQAITNRKEWPEVALELSIKNLSKLKDFYYQYVYPYEQKYYFGKQGDDDLPNMICGQPRKMVKIDSKQIANPIQPSVQSQQIQAQNQNQPQNVQKATKQDSNNLQEQIIKKFEEQERQRKMFFLNKNKLNQTKAETKKIILGLESFMDRRDVIYSLNMLMLYSMNNLVPFLFENNEKIFVALSNFTHLIYPPKNQQALQDLRNITLIFRNFTMNPVNLKFMLGSSIFQLFVKMFNQGLDKQCSKNIIDIMSGLVKVGWDCKRIISDLDTAVLDQQIQTIQNSIELLRGLVDEREQTLINIIPENLKIFNRILMNPAVSIQVKQQVFEILAFVTDASPQSRQLIAKNFCLMGIIVQILQNMRNHEKLTQLAALTLNNISTAMYGKASIKQFETELVTIGFSDDSLAGIIANILADIATL